MMVRTPPPALLALVFIATVICATSATTVVRESRNTKQTLEEFVADLLAEESKKANYRYGYNIVAGNKDDSEFSHLQKVEDGTTRGEYRILLPDDRWQIVSYVADENGYRATVRYEPASTYTPQSTTEKASHWGYNRNEKNERPPARPPAKSPAPIREPDDETDVRDHYQQKPPRYQPDNAYPQRPVPSRQKGEPVRSKPYSRPEKNREEIVTDGWQPLIRPSTAPVDLSTGDRLVPLDAPQHNPHPPTKYHSSDYDTIFFGAPESEVRYPPVRIRPQPEAHFLPPLYPNPTAERAPFYHPVPPHLSQDPPVRNKKVPHTGYPEGIPLSGVIVYRPHLAQKPTHPPIREPVAVHDLDSIEGVAPTEPPEEKLPPPPSKKPTLHRPRLPVQEPPPYFDDPHSPEEIPRPPWRKPVEGDSRRPEEPRPPSYTGSSRKKKPSDDIHHRPADTEPILLSPYRNPEPPPERPKIKRPEPEATVQGRPKYNGHAVPSAGATAEENPNNNNNKNNNKKPLIQVIQRPPLSYISQSKAPKAPIKSAIKKPADDIKVEEPVAEDQHETPRPVKKPSIQLIQRPKPVELDPPKPPTRGKIHRPAQNHPIPHENEPEETPVVKKRPAFTGIPKKAKPGDEKQGNLPSVLLQTFQHVSPQSKPAGQSGEEGLLKTHKFKQTPGDNFGTRTQPLRRPESEEVFDFTPHVQPNEEDDDRFVHGDVVFREPEDHDSDLEGFPVIEDEPPVKDHDAIIFPEEGVSGGFKPNHSNRTTLAELIAKVLASTTTPAPATSTEPYTPEASPTKGRKKRPKGKRRKNNKSGAYIIRNETTTSETPSTERVIRIHPHQRSRNVQQERFARHDDDVWYDDDIQEDYDDYSDVAID